MRVCSGPGCLRAVPDSKRFCDECKPVRAESSDIKTHSTGYDAALDALRKGTRWQRLRALIVRRDPICKRCDLSITAEVDHIVPAREAIAQTQVSGAYPADRNAGYYLPSNLQGLCRQCHIQKTIDDKAHVGAWPDVVATERAAPKRRFHF